MLRKRYQAAGREGGEGESTLTVRKRKRNLLGRLRRSRWRGKRNPTEQSVTEAQRQKEEQLSPDDTKLDK